MEEGVLPDTTAINDGYNRKRYHRGEEVTSIPDESLQLVVTSPPYNIGKEYEKKLDLDAYLRQQAQVIAECVRVLSWPMDRPAYDPVRKS